MDSSIRLNEYINTSSGTVSLLNIMGDEATIVNAARVSFGKRTDLMRKKDIKLMKYLWTHRHTSPFEKVTLLLHITCPLPVRSQWMRHRTWSYNEVSRRYTGENLSYYIPEEFRGEDKENTQASTPIDIEDSARLKRKCEDICLLTEDFYHELIDAGVCKEQSRFYLTQALMTEFYAKVDLKNLMDFLVLRRAPDAQYEIRILADAIYELLRPHLPNVMDILDGGKWVWVENDQTERSSVL